MFIEHLKPRTLGVDFYCQISEKNLYVELDMGRYVILDTEARKVSSGTYYIVRVSVAIAYENNAATLKAKRGKEIQRVVFLTSSHFCRRKE